MDDFLAVTDFDLESDKLNQLASQQAWSLDNQLHVQFVKHAELNSFKTAQEGRKIFEEHVYVRILAPANRLNEIFRRASDEDRQRFARQFRAFLANAEVLQIGTPLSELPTITAAQVLELKHLKIDTIEQLSGMADSTAQLLGTGGLELKQRAIRHLDKLANSEKLSGEVRDLRAQLEDALSKIEQLGKGQSAIKVTEFVIGEKAPGVGPVADEEA